jgi:FMN reductase
VADARGPTIVGLGGSLAQTSRSRAALSLALEGAEHAGATTQLLDLRSLNLPIYDPDEEAGEAARQLMEACYASDGLIWSSPLYQGTISGAFKNALDWLHDLGRRDPPFLHDKVIGLVSASGGTQGLQAINTMEFSVRALRGWRVFGADGKVEDEAVESQLRMLGSEVVRVVRRFTDDAMLHRQAECAEAAERVAAA